MCAALVIRLDGESNVPVCRDREDWKPSVSYDAFTAFKTHSTFVAFISNFSISVRVARSRFCIATVGGIILQPCTCTKKASPIIQKFWGWMKFRRKRLIGRESNDHKLLLFSRALRILVTHGLFGRDTANVRRGRGTRTPCASSEGGRSRQAPKPRGVNYFVEFIHKVARM